MLVIKPYTQGDFKAIEVLLQSVEWADQYVAGQLASISKMFIDPEGDVLVAMLSGSIVGFIQTQHYLWNRLSHIHGLVISPKYQKQGIGCKLVEHAEASAKKRGNRGLYVDTPVNNFGACSFYQAIGFLEGYIMPSYYEAALDGVTFQKIFVSDSVQKSNSEHQ